jgi:hypothetical protein
MKGFWTNTRYNGQPLQPGTCCWVTDLEDGTNPIYTYGQSTEEVLEKLAMQNANAQLALARRASASPTPANGTAQVPNSPSPAAAPRRGISPDQVMQATADLQNPAKAGEAVATLLEAATGMDPIEQARWQYARLAMDWEAATPAFYPHPGNRQLVGEKAIRMAGNKPGLVTRAILDAAFRQLDAEGLLFERPEEPFNNTPPNGGNNSTHSTFPDESQVQPTERPRGTRFATGARSSSFSAPQTAQTRALKYTEEQIRTMPEKERLRVFNDPDYIRACEYYFSGARA